MSRMVVRKPVTPVSLCQCTQPKKWHADELAVKHKCNKEHARRICRDLFNQQEIERHQLASTGGRKRWVYAHRTFPTPEQVGCSCGYIAPVWLELYIFGIASNTGENLANLSKLRFSLDNFQIQRLSH